MTQKEELKQIIANADYDVQIVRNDNALIAEMLLSDGYGYHTVTAVREAVAELRADAYYSRLIAQGVFN